MKVEPTATSDESVASLLPLADEFSRKSLLLYKLLKKPLYDGEVSIPRARVLSYLLENGPQRIRTLAQAEQVSQPSMTTMVASLERARWVKRKPDATDGRAVLISITPAGRSVILRQRSRRAEAFAERLAVLPSSEIDDIAVALRSIEHVIELLEADEN